MPSEPEDRSPAEEEPGGIAAAVEKAAGEQLDVRDFDRHAIFRDTADAASNDTLAFWLVLGLSAAIATIGLAQNNSAVVIGAMLVAPLLSPLMGLALSMAVGDIRLAVQTGLTILIGLAMVIVVAWVLTVLLPFQTITPEIAARTRLPHSTLRSRSSRDWPARWSRSRGAAGSPPRSPGSRSPSP